LIDAFDWHEDVGAMEVGFASGHGDRRFAFQRRRRLTLVVGEPMKPLHTALIVGSGSAIIAWSVAFAVLHETNPRTLPDGSLFYVMDHHGQDEDLTSLLWAAGAYILTFTPTLLLLRGRVSKDEFAPPQSGG
jgi:hypothetical protein